MTRIVVPFRGSGAKSRLAGTPAERTALALAMLGDVLAACTAAGETVLVTDGAGARALALELGARVAADPGAGQGPAVETALAGLPPGPVLVVNGDLPCLVPDDLRRLAASTPPGGIALVAAADGTTNALGLAEPGLFTPLYGPGSAARFELQARARGLDLVPVRIAGLEDDVDTLADLRRLRPRVGRRTDGATACLLAGAP